ncbi:DUF4180 domain-containing protein [Empedobacter falsenii]|uniref:DUF4180 domain-containing protein n=1 Tax=Empedobacter falsenii TaxID=343874 RepID=A0A376GG63_9FLAO|nr:MULTISPECIES: DUF4180 domain-containing protein [Empedobacter]HAD79796.1 DUF4180 domain-containing protein [Flavobacteriaceae bacterium]MDH1881123.1 DUF4180 domain-containing protein [Empedobacter sp. GD03797]MDM1039999.1 DUF4180 domain-containing protein [Empedobacter brevis]MDM1133931.1 DUF4180 domain-containing protein [Empedobacter sp. R750]STD58890.1 Uncharacterised protein [Empedobacter falsenii]
MTINIIKLNDENIVEITRNGIFLTNTEDAMQLMMDCKYEHQAYKAIFYQENITPDFFELKTKLADEMLQKFTQYGFEIAIVGDFRVYESKSLNDFIFESNKAGKFIFVATKDEALSRWNIA